MLRTCRYGRILSRIKKEPYARKILQWIACAKAPLTELQLLQALLIKPLMSDFHKQNKAYLDIRRQCGPLIEVQDDRIRFTHFTVQEWVEMPSCKSSAYSDRYFFGRQSERFLSELDAHTEAASVSLVYLSFNTFDGIFSPDLESVDEHLIRDRILAGDYIFFHYATRFWLEHTQVTGQTSKDVDTLCELVAQFYEDRSQPAKEAAPVPKLQSFLADFRSFDGRTEVQRSLASSALFRDRLAYGHLISEGKSNFRSFHLKRMTR